MGAIPVNGAKNMRENTPILKHVGGLRPHRSPQVHRSEKHRLESTVCYNVFSVIFGHFQWTTL